MNDREILEDLCPNDPWTHSSEGLDDCCMFCGSGRWRRELPSEDAPEWKRVTVYEHEHACAWIKAMAHLGRPLPFDHRTLTPDPPPPPCDVCEADPDATLDSHVAHLAAEYAVRREKILARRAAGLPDESYADYFPIVHAPRGAIVFATPPGGLLVTPDPPVAAIDELTEDERGIVARGSMAAPPSPLYDFLRLTRPELPEQYEPTPADMEDFVRCEKDGPTGRCVRWKGHTGDCAG